jgi:hypothetical protein
MTDHSPSHIRGHTPLDRGSFANTFTGTVVSAVRGGPGDSLAGSPHTPLWSFHQPRLPRCCGSAYRLAEAPLHPGDAPATAALQRSAALPPLPLRVPVTCQAGISVPRLFVFPASFPPKVRISTDPRALAARVTALLRSLRGFRPCASARVGPGASGSPPSSLFCGPPTQHGFIALIQDTEGNTVGLHSPN